MIFVGLWGSQCQPGDTYSTTQPLFLFFYVEFPSYLDSGQVQVKQSSNEYGKREWERGSPCPIFTDW
jgi:hypothetical protein